MADPRVTAFTSDALGSSDAVELAERLARKEVSASELVEELAPLVLRDADGGVQQASRERSRFTSAADAAFVPLEPRRVVEVAFDQLEGRRFRHAVTFLRWRPDREPSSCLLEQVEVPVAYDLAEVLQS